MGLVGMLGVTLASGTMLWPTFGDIVWNTTTNFSLVSIPLFVLMGELILQSGISGRFYSGIAGLFRRVPGGLAQTNIAGCAIFSAIAGSSVATALTVGTVAITEMRARGYADTLTLGTLTAGGCLGILIPPSIPLIVYGSMTQESVIDLFMAGVVPGHRAGADLLDLCRGAGCWSSRTWCRRADRASDYRRSVRELVSDLVPHRRGHRRHVFRRRHADRGLRLRLPARAHARARSIAN